jgi:opacity protein-like surface antigen
MMKRIILPSLLCLLPSLTLASNSAHGFYLGGNLVFAAYKPAKGCALNNHLIPIADYFQPYIGYRINDYFAIESAFNCIVNDHSNGGEPVTDPFGDEQKWGPDHYKLHSVELAVKVIKPFFIGLSVYGKVGAALVHQDVFNQIYQNDTPLIDSVTDKMLPVLGGGINYNFTQHIAADISFTHTQAVKSIGNINTIGVGLNYTF